METTSQIFMFWFVNAVWQIALIVAAAFVCDRLLGRISARVRHGLWVATLGLAIAIPVITAFNSARVAPSIPLEQIEFGTLSAEAGSIADVAQNTQSFANTTIPVSDTLWWAVVAFFIAIFCFRGYRLSAAWFRTRGIAQSVADTEPNERDSELFGECRSAIGVENVRFIYSNSVTSPVTVGAFRPVIVLPASLSSDADREVLVSAVSHELIHVRRRDYLLNLIYEIILLPIAFHPAATLVKRRIKETRELVCDEYVAGRMVERSVYARSLVHLAGMAVELGRGSSISIGILDADVLETRIMKILNKSNISDYRRNLLLTSASLVFIAALIATVSFTIVPAFAQQTEKATIEAKKKAELDAMKQKIEKDGLYKTELYKTQSDEELVNLKRKLAAERGQMVVLDKPVSDRGYVTEVDVDPNLAEQVIELKLKTELDHQKVERDTKNWLVNRPDLMASVKISMSEAIEIATKQQPGTVTETRLAFERNGSEVQEPFYIVVIIPTGTDGEKTAKKIVVSGLDGQIGGPTKN